MYQEIKDLLIEILNKANLEFQDVAIDTENDIDGVWYVIKSENPNIFVGKNGETLDAINHIMKRFVEEKYPEVKGVVVDAGDFKKNKVTNLKSIAHMFAERAKFFKSHVEVEPMNSFERRIIHLHLEKYPGIKTESAGEGKNRHVVIRYTEE